MRQADHTEARWWLARHGSADAEPTPLLAARLAVRRRAVLPVSDSSLRYGPIVVLIGLAGAGASTVMQLRQVLASPAVAEDEASLTADVIMRVEDARALVTPSLVWSLPAIFLYGESLGWWNAVALALVVAGAIAFHLIHSRTTGVGAAARRAMATR